MVICGGCGTENDADSYSFCPECGTVLKNTDELGVSDKSSTSSMKETSLETSSAPTQSRYLVDEDEEDDPYPNETNFLLVIMIYMAVSGVVITLFSVIMLRVGEIETFIIYAVLGLSLLGITKGLYDNNNQARMAFLILSTLLLIFSFSISSVGLLLIAIFNLYALGFHPATVELFTSETISTSQSHAK